MEPHHGGPAVLVLEDDDAVRGVFARVLRQHGYTPVLSATVPEAIAAASEHDLDAVTLDLSLGVGAGGVDFLTWFRNMPAHRDTPAVVLTGSPVLSRDEANRLDHLRARVFFKPQPYAVLIEHLATTLARNHA